MTLPSAPAHEFLLPLGYADASGRVHRRGLMRLATAYDEIEPLADPRVQQNEAFLGLLLLARVVTRLGDFSPVPPEVIAGLYTADFAYLQQLYVQVNTPLSPLTPAAQGGVASPERAGPVETTCPSCGAELVLELDA